MYKRLFIPLLAIFMIVGCSGFEFKRQVRETFGEAEQRVQVGDGIVVMSPAIDGKRELAYFIRTGDASVGTGTRVRLANATAAGLSAESGRVVVETARDGAPQYQAFLPTEAGLEPTDYYASTAPKAPVKEGHSIIVNKRLNVLWHYHEGQLVRAYRVSTGRQTKPPAPTWDDYKANYFTPEGAFTLTNFVVEPPFNALKPGDVSYAGGEPGNPLGTRWMGFGVLPNDRAWLWGIHGTSHPELIGTWASDGCIRMYTDDAEGLFDLLRGQKVALRIVPN